MSYRGRYLAIRHDGQAVILEGEYGEHYQYAERDAGVGPEEHARMLENRYDLPPGSDTMYTRHTLRNYAVHGPSGRFRVFLPADWSSEECNTWAAANERVYSIGPALDDPHQTNRSRQIERHFHGV